jgi:hypothetical protein
LYFIIYKFKILKKKPPQKENKTEYQTKSKPMEKKKKKTDDKRCIHHIQHK